ncbi:hypothetical protein [Pantanalinema sp. GBBB05]|uniref:hypothetical protein n=1 Tax=Pantanalinema sp. GBBB05 TaxID=2604139 RepID=UPI003D819DC1
MVSIKVEYLRKSAEESSQLPLDDDRWQPALQGKETQPTQQQFAQREFWEMI